MMGACGPKDKGGSPVISAEKAPLGLSSLSDKDFARHFAVPKRKIDENEGQNALAALGLTESNTDGLVWDNQTGSNGNYIFTNMKSTSEDGIISIGKAELFGVHMKDGNATFDRADFESFSLSGQEVDIKIDAMSLAKPTADTAKAIIKSLEDLSQDLNLDFGDEAKFGFGGLSIKSADITADQLTGTIGQLVWGLDEDTQRADVKLENLDFSLPSTTSDVASIMTLKSFSARDYNAKDLTKGFAAGASGSAPDITALLAGFSAYDKPYDSINLEAFNFDSSGINVNLPKIEAKAKVKGDVTTITQVLAPMTVTMKDGNNGPARQAYDIAKELGFDTMTFKSSQTTILDKSKDTIEVKDGIFDMDEGFRLNYTYEASGLKALESLSDEQSSADLASILENMSVSGMTLSLEDKSIVERGLKLAAQMRGKDVNAVKREMRAAMAFAPLAARNDVEKDIVGQLSSAFMDFIDDSGTFTIQIAPPTPIAFSKLDNIEALSPEDIGFSARQDSRP